MRKLYTKSFAILLFVVFISITSASMVHAQENPNKIDFTPVTDIPLLENWSPGQTINAEAGASNIFNQLFSLSIQIGAMLAVFMFIWGGLNIIMARDNATVLTRGKEKMKNAVFGLLMLLSTFVVLNTINPNLVNISLFGDSTVRLSDTAYSTEYYKNVDSLQKQRIDFINKNGYAPLFCDTTRCTFDIDECLQNFNSCELKDNLKAIQVDAYGGTIPITITYTDQNDGYTLRRQYFNDMYDCYIFATQQNNLSINSCVYANLNQMF